jgi:hypothetical protein
MGPVAVPPERRPLSGSAIDAWVVGLSDVEAGLAIVAAGLDLEQWYEMRSALEAELFHDRRSELRDRFLTWTAPDPAALQTRRPLELIGQVGVEVLADRRPEFRDLPFIRLAVTGDVVPGEVVDRLLLAPGVASAVLGTIRPPEALRRRAWRWPLRVGVLGAGLDLRVLAAEAERAGQLPSQLIDIRDLAVAAGAVDVLVVAAPLERATALVVQEKPIANAILVLDDISGRWPLIDAQLAAMRAVTSASVAAIGPSESLAMPIGRLLRQLSHAAPFDAALTEALNRRIVITGELDALGPASVPHIAIGHGRMLHDSVGRMRMLPAALPPMPRARLPRAFPVSAMSPDDLETAGWNLETLADGGFDAELHEASVIGAEMERAEAGLDAMDTMRWLQCSVRHSTEPAALPSVLRRGANAVDVFVGPLEEGALHLVQGIAAGELGFDEPDLVSARLTVVLVPLTPRGSARHAELDVPRVGRSATVTLMLDVPDDATRVAARLLLFHGNRLLQTAVLRGVVDQLAELVEARAVRADLAHLDDRRSYDVALFANHAPDGLEALIAHASGHTRVSTSGELVGILARIRDILGTAVFIPARVKPSAKVRQVLVELAIAGRDLHDQLGARLAAFENARRIQLVTASSGWFLPLELAYGRFAPNRDAKICPSWLAGGAGCGPTCGTGPTDRSIVCPAAFWGMSRTIERLHYEGDDLDSQVLLLAEPTAQAHKVPIGATLVGASAQVTKADVTKMLDAIAPGAVRALTWPDWRQKLATRPTNLLLLMPHCDQATLEIDKTILDRGQIEFDYVTGGHPVTPIVALFGCDTAGTREDPAGFATRFLTKQAAIVITSLCPLLNKHAVALSQRLATMLRDPVRPEQSLGEFMTTFRSTLLSAGVVAALAITAYGDNDWTV